MKTITADFSSNKPVCIYTNLKTGVYPEIVFKEENGGLRQSDGYHQNGAVYGYCCIPQIISFFKSIITRGDT